MAMVSVVNWQPTGGLMVQANRLSPMVGGHLAPCCTLRVNQGELSQCCYSMMTLSWYYYYYYYYYQEYVHWSRSECTTSLSSLIGGLITRTLSLRRVNSFVISSRSVNRKQQTSVYQHNTLNPFSRHAPARRSCLSNYLSIYPFIALINV